MHAGPPVQFSLSVQVMSLNLVLKIDVLAELLCKCKSPYSHPGQFLYCNINAPSI